MNVLSLFDGMSCGRIALERAGVPVDRYFASEIDKYAIQITQKNYPDTIQLGDVTRWREWDLPKIDLLIGGSPCQAFSDSGWHKKGYDDPRVQLFFQYQFCLHHFQPTYFLFENVVMKKQWRDMISDCLGVEPIRINSSALTAQSRDRLYWTNIPDVAQPEDRGILLKDIIDGGFVDREKSYCIDANYWKGVNLEMYMKKSRRQIVIIPEDFVYGKGWRLLTPEECERLQTVPVGYTDGVSNLQRYKMLGNGWTVDVIAHILSFIPQGVPA